MNVKCTEKYHRMLVINGGGVKGIIPARILQEFETITGKRVTDLFDSVVGTSVGGIIGAALLVPDEKNPGTPKYSPEYMVNLMLDRSKEIFPEKGLTSSGYTTGAVALSGLAAGANTAALSGLATGAKAGSFMGLTGAAVGGILGAAVALSAQSYATGGDGTIMAKYDREGLDNILKEHFGNLQLTDTIKPVTLTSFSLDKDGPRIWSTFRAEKKPSKYNFPLKDATAATSAAPTYFQPHVTELPDGRTFIDVDGALFANHPIFVGARVLKDVYRSKSETLSCDDTYDKLVVVSLGTGRSPGKEIKSLSSWSPTGGISWMMGDRITDKLLRASEQSDEIASGIFTYSKMINIEIEEKLSELDNSKRDNLLALKARTEQYLSSKKSEISKLASCLKEVGEKNSIDTENCVKAFEMETKEGGKRKTYDLGVFPPGPDDYHYEDTKDKNIIGSNADHDEF